MGAFDTVVNTMYPSLIILADARVTHAHNELLQVKDFQKFGKVS